MNIFRPLISIDKLQEQQKLASTDSQIDTEWKQIPSFHRWRDYNELHCP